MLQLKDIDWLNGYKNKLKVGKEYFMQMEIKRKLE